MSTPPDANTEAVAEAEYAAYRDAVPLDSERMTVHPPRVWTKALNKRGSPYYVAGVRLSPIVWWDILDVERESNSAITEEIMIKYSLKDRESPPIMSLFFHYNRDITVWFMENDCPTPLIMEFLRTKDALISEFCTVLGCDETQRQTICDNFKWHKEV
ncbi:hypothetical protein CVT24_012452 [Panaeolus cyanescens]|uniref:Uncharacterized protein n=1 Tax=Panaeolus cyanescens TaxID=181874 RepID=A0A409YYP2_9AGAR|nr:hypothetical protein CVT24_012452 [Panaeolus cyanescens]